MRERGRYRYGGGGWSWGGDSSTTAHRLRHNLAHLIFNQNHGRTVESRNESQRAKYCCTPFSEDVRQTAIGYILLYRERMRVSVDDVVVSGYTTVRTALGS